MDQGQRYLVAGAILAGSVALALSLKNDNGTPPPNYQFAMTSFTASPTFSGRLLNLWHNGIWPVYDLYLNDVKVERILAFQPVVYDAQFSQLRQGQNDVYLVSFDSYTSTQGKETTPSAFFNI